MKRINVPTIEGEIAVALEWPRNAASWYYRFYLHGKRFYRATDERDVRKAEIKARRAVEEMTCSSSGSPTDALVRSYLEARWPEEKSETLSDHRSRLGQFSQHVSTISIDSFDSARDAIQTYLDSRLKQRLAPRTIKNDQLALSRFCAWLLKRPGAVRWKANPAAAALLDMPPCEHHVSPPSPPSAQLQFLRTIRGTDLWTVGVLCLGAGLRPIEALRLDWKDVDLEQKHVKVFSKRRGRVVPLCPGVLTALKKESGPVWPYKPRWAYVSLERMGAGIGLQECRRTAAFRISREVDPMTYARIMGHTLAVAANHYLYFDTMSLSEPQVLHPNDWETRLASEKASESKKEKVTSR